ncbi:TPA: hypothetical protein DCF80_02470 [Candidatus Saccharibacteria bacterium]|nr:hypothetical protein [Candidatus Saccharibacteria bacterium]HRK40761.1 prepilin-type N-terminal cleavage/methylation domain-containing protein [Candidatus Saccharibacteria bacterium]
MSSHKYEQGFSMIELLIAAVVIGIMSGTIFIFFTSSTTSFFQIQESSIVVNDKTRVLYRMAQVIRSGTTINEASSNALTIYAYFSPQDTTLSQVRYYYTAADRTLKVDRIRATGTAPNYTYPPANTETKTLLDGITLTGTVFSYLDANGSSGPFTTDTYKDIKSVTLDLNSASTKSVTASQLKTSIELRNRKTNL